MPTYEAFTTQAGKTLYLCSDCTHKAFGSYKLGVVLTHIKKVHSDD